MNLEKAKYTIELDRSEVIEIAFSLKYNLLKSIEDHYNKLQQEKDGEPVFDDQEKSKVRLLEELSKLSGYQIFEDFQYQKTALFNNKRKEREK